MRLNDILDMVSAYAPDANLDLVMRAYVFAAKAHAGQVRRSGEPYLIHPVAVAGILAGLKMDVDTIATALLHDTVEDTLVTREELVGLFSEEIADLVDGVTKIGKLQFRSRAEAQAENFRKMVLAMSRDIRVILVKLADRLHNMRTLEHMRPDKQRRIALETMEIYAPIANRLGLGQIKEQLETLCFRYIHPEAYTTLLEALDQGQEERRAYIERNSRLLAEHLAKHDMRCEVTGRAKALFSIHRKMVQKNLEFGQVHDLLAFRVFVDTVSQCYEALGYVHGQFWPVPGEFDDYIAMRKPNGYQSLHTAIMGPEGQRIEIQIRTWEMHRVAQTGIAAHWRYKEGHLALKQEEIRALAQLRELFETAREVEDPNEFMQTVKVDLFNHEVFVFTPAREVKVMSVGATALDFAYAVHTEVGNHCVGVKVNERMVPLRYELASGDTVEILTRADQSPSRDWLRIAKTGRALSKIRRALREKERERGVGIGRDMLAAELKRHGRNLNRLLKDGKVKEVAKAHGHKDAERLFLEVARGQMGLVKVARELAPDADWEVPREDKPTTAFTSILNRIRRRQENAVLISGQTDVLVSYAKCCKPLPGEEVVGFITRGRGITVHLAACPQLLATERERRVPVQWESGVRINHTSDLRIVCADRPGLLSNITKCCEAGGINIGRLDARPIEDSKAIIHLEVLVSDVKQLTKLIANMEKVKGVVSVGRVRH